MAIDPTKPLNPRSGDGTPLSGQPDWALGRDSFKRSDDSSEQMNIDGRATGAESVLWNGTGGGDSGGDWTASGKGSETAGSMHAGTNGWDTTVMAENDSVVFNNGSLVDIVGGYSELKFWIQPKAFPANSRPKVAWLDAADAKIGNALRIDDYTPNMDLDVWQQVTIPIADFALTADVQKLRIQAKNTAGQHYWLDDIELVASNGSGPYRFEFVAPDANTVYHVSMLVLMIGAPSTGWNSDAFANIAGGLSKGVIVRHKDTVADEVLWKFVVKDNLALYGLFHPQDDVIFADDVMVVGFMVKPGPASIKVTNTDELHIVIRDNLSTISNMRAYAHYAVEEMS
jgi:hypothetical protein